MAKGSGFSGGKSGILALEINDERELYELYEHYMPFVQGGALFVPTKRNHELGDELFFLLSIYILQPFKKACDLGDEDRCARYSEICDTSYR